MSVCITGRVKNDNTLTFCPIVLSKKLWRKYSFTIKQINQLNKMNREISP